MKPGTLVGRRGCCCVNLLCFTNLSNEKAFCVQAVEFEGAPPQRVCVPRSKGQTTCQDHNLQHPSLIDNKQKLIGSYECCQNRIARWTVRWLQCKQAHARQSGKIRFAPAANAPAANAADVSSFVHYDDIDKWTKESECSSVA